MLKKQKNNWKGLIKEQPATRWQDAIPCGNGTLGALIYGNIKNELITLNHENLWLESPRPQLQPVHQYLDKFRELLLEGKYEEGLAYFTEKIEANYSGFDTTDPYQPVFDIKLDMDTGGAFTDYSGSLDFRTGEAEIKWQAETNNYQRNLFVSRADDAVIMNISADGSDVINCDLTLIPTNAEGASGMGSGKDVDSDQLPFSYSVTAEVNENGWLTLEAEQNNGNKFGGLARISVDGGQITVADNKLQIKDAREVLMITKLYVNKDSDPALTRLRQELKGINEDYRKLLDKHITLHKELFERMELDLTIDNDNLNNNEIDNNNTLVDKVYTNERLLSESYQGEVNINLIQRMFDYGRYLLISSSRPGGLPANLQGVWNGDYKPAWSSDYHNDENIQMNYWQALPGNLTELTEPYFDYYESMVKDFRENAKKIYDCRGILVPIAQTTHGLLYTGPWVTWTAGAGWLARIFYDYWLFTGDKDFLENRAVPFLKEVAQFYEDFLIEDDDEQLMFVPSLSPENTPDIENGSLVTINATMDVAIAREVLHNLCQACELLEIEEENLQTWQDILSRLPQYEINEDGAIREWLYPGLKDNYHHRHQSHIYPLFPGLEVTEEKEPELYEAIKVAVEKRLTIGLTSQTGWSFAHMANIYARLGEGNRGLECLELLCRSCTGPNLFTYHNDWRSQGLTMYWGHGSQPPFQIDANFGFTAAVLEMLVYSRPGMIKMLPALPDKWGKGQVDGILCRGGITMSLAWDMEQKEMEISFLSQKEQEVQVKFPDIPEKIQSPTAAISESESGAQYRDISLPEDEEAIISVKLH